MRAGELSQQRPSEAVFIRNVLLSEALADGGVKAILNPATNPGRKPEISLNVV